MCASSGMSDYRSRKRDESPQLSTRSAGGEGTDRHGGDDIKLLATEQRRHQFIEIQLDFSRTLVRATDLTEVFEALLKTLSRFVDYDATSIMVFSPAHPDVGNIAAVSGYTQPDEALGRTIRISDYPLLQRLIDERLPVYFPDLRESAEWRPSSQSDRQEVRSIVLVPLLDKNDVHGCLTLKSFQTDAFGSDERQNIFVLCNHTAAVVRKLQLFEETRRRLYEASVLAEVSGVLNRTFEVEDMLQFVLDRVVAIVSQDAGDNRFGGSIILRQPHSDVLRIAVATNLSQDEVERFNSRPVYAHEGSFGRSILQGEWVESRDIETLQASTIPSIARLEELTNIPLRVGDEVIGVIALNRVMTDPSSRHLLGALADLTAAAIHKAQLLVDAQERAVELMSAYEELQHVINLKDEFFQNISHEIRTPLTFMHGYVELMLDGVMGELTPEQREFLEIIQERAMGLVKLANETLDMERPESPPLKQEPVDLVEVVSSSARGAYVVAQKAGLEIVTDIESELPTIVGDVDRLGQVCDNLLSNAIKFSPDGGVIQVRAAQRGNRVVVSVADPGVGIPPEQLEHIWGRFYQVRGSARPYSGSGLGLAIVRRIVEAHGGRVWAESDEGGSTFHVELPCARS